MSPQLLSWRSEGSIIGSRLLVVKHRVERAWAQDQKKEDMQQLWCEIPLAECFLCRLPTSLFLKAICTSEPIA